MEAYDLKDSGVDWLGDIPNHWRIRKVKRDFDVLLGKMIQPEQRREHDKEYSYLRAANIGWSGVKTNDVKTMWFQPFEVKKYALKQEDLLVSEGGDVGKSSLWNGELKDCFYQNAINRVRAKQSNNTHFLYYWIYFLKHIGFVDSIINRITIAHLTAEKLEALPILICSPVEQKAIADYLDKACQNIDKTITLKQQQLEKLEAYRKSVIHEAVTKGLNKTVPMKDSGVDWLGCIPGHWNVKRIKDIADLKSGNAITSLQIQSKGRYPVYGGNGLRGYTESYTHEGYKVLIGRQGDLCGNINYVNGIYFATEHAVVCNPYFDLNIFWFGELLRAMNLNQYSNAAAQAGLAVGKIKNLKIPLPTKDERVAIEFYLKNVCKKIDATKATMENQIKTLTQYRQSLIHECVTGKKRIYQG